MMHRALRRVRRLLEDCPFCEYQGPSPVLSSGKDAFIIEPLNPVARGHLLCISKRHLTDFTDDPYLTGRVVAFGAAWVEVMDEGTDYNLITSKGPAATQTVGHLHVHLVPRWEDDGLLLPWSEGSGAERAKSIETAGWQLAESLEYSSPHPRDALAAWRKATK